MGAINRLTARFESEATEHQYRQEYLASDKKKIYTVLILIAVFCLAFIFSDLRVQEAQKWLNQLLLGRIAAASLVPVCWLICHRSRNENLIDFTVLVTVILFNLFISIVNCTRPVDYYTYLFVDLLVIFVSFLYVPNRFLYQVLPVTLFMVTEIIVFFNFRTMPDAVSLFAMGVSFLVAVVIGLLAAHSRHISNRKMFLSWRAEKDLREKYEEALGKIKTLSGLLPICASCKKIRDDKGYWNHIEQYIREHSEAEFTHGLCPDCIKKLYPQLSEKSRERI